MEEYQELELEIIYFDAKDVITESETPTGPDWGQPL